MSEEQSEAGLGAERAEQSEAGAGRRACGAIRSRAEHA